MSDRKRTRASMPRWLSLVMAGGLSLTGLAACEGSIDGASGGTAGTAPLAGGSSVGGSASAASVGPRPLSRLTRREYNNTVRDLLKDATHPADAFPEDRERTFLFRRAGVVATQDAELLSTTAEGLAKAAMAKPADLLPCDPATGEDACAAKFIAEFGKRAYRRPLHDVETTRLTTLYQTCRTTQKLSFNESIQTLIEAMLQSPAFLYHWESPYAAPLKVGGGLQLGSYDIASRLSYFIWGSMPDQELFEAAESGKLGTEAEVAEQARRMLADAKAKDAAVAFFREWLEIDGLAAVPKDPEANPGYDDALKAALVAGTEAFTQNVLFEAGGKLETLLTADYTFANQAMGKLYGNGATGTTLTKTSVDTTQRLGLLMEPSFLALTGATDGSHPVKRGKAVFTKLMCGTLPPPPPNVPPAKPASEGGTTRQRFAEHDQNACAKGCHALIDPIGYAFEHYDGIGRYRTMDNGQAVDASGMLNIDGTVKPFADAVELTRVLATSDTVRSCFAKQWFRFALRRVETDTDAKSLAAVASAFAANGFDMRDLAPAIATSPSFRFRSLAAGEVTQ